MSFLLKQFNKLKEQTKEAKNNLNEQNNKVDALSSDINAKLNELSSNVNEQKTKCESSFNELIKRFDESNEKWERDRCKWKENKESDLNQVSSFDSGGKNDDNTFTKNSASVSAVEIKNDKVGDVSTSDNQKADS